MPNVTIHSDCGDCLTDVTIYEHLPATTCRSSDPRVHSERINEESIDNLLSYDIYIQYRGDKEAPFLKVVTALFTESDKSGLSLKQNYKVLFKIGLQKAPKKIVMTAIHRRAESNLRRFDFLSPEWSKEIKTMTRQTRLTCDSGKPLHVMAVISLFCASVSTSPWFG